MKDETFHEAAAERANLVRRDDDAEREQDAMEPRDHGRTTALPDLDRRELCPIFLEVNVRAGFHDILPKVRLGGGKRSDVYEPLVCQRSHHRSYSAA